MGWASVSSHGIIQCVDTRRVSIFRIICDLTLHRQHQEPTSFIFRRSSGETVNKSLLHLRLHNLGWREFDSRLFKRLSIEAQIMFAEPSGSDASGSAQKHFNRLSRNRRCLCLVCCDGHPHHVYQSSQKTRFSKKRSVHSRLTGWEKTGLILRNRQKCTLRDFFLPLHRATQV